MGRGPTGTGLLRTWLPTAFGAWVLVAGIPVVYAAAARTTDGAALGICVSVLVVVDTPALAPAHLVLAARRPRCPGASPPGWAAGFTVEFAVVVLSGAGAVYLRQLVGVPDGPAALALGWAPVHLYASSWRPV